VCGRKRATYIAVGPVRPDVARGAAKPGSQVRHLRGGGYAGPLHH
jgi:hypothetical protein